MAFGAGGLVEQRAEAGGRGEDGLKHELTLREQQPGFFKQLRMDVCALYLSDPGVWARIGFPGPSSAQGGYPDFDRPQS